jgi:hypothetical protein
MPDLVGTGGARFAGPPPAITVSLGGLLLLFVASRLLYLVLIHPSFLSPQLIDELYRGAIAQELDRGLTMPFIDYRADNHSGGHLVIGALAACFFLLFGPTVFALKLAPLLAFTLALTFWYWTIQCAAGERVAKYFAFLFCFSPPLFTAYSVTTMGFHSESIVFSALTVLLLFRMLSDETDPPAVPALLGLTAGFGLWFAYIYGLTLLAMLGVWLWHDKGKFWRPRVAWFALGFLIGFSPWIVMNLKTHFAGFVVYGINVWEHFGLDHLWEVSAHPRKLAPVEFLASLASDDSWNLYRRVVNLLYAILYLGPILTAGVLRLKTGRSGPAGANFSGRGPREMRPSRTHPIRPTLVVFAILYLVVFTLAVQFSDFRAARYYLPAYPFLFLFTALSFAYCQDRFPHVQRKVQTVFLASLVALGLGAHAPLLSLDRPGYTLSAKGYSYAWMPLVYLDTHVPALAGSDEHEFILQVVQRPFFSSILPKLAADDQRDLSRAIALLLAENVPLNGQPGEFARFEQAVPPGFDRYFYYQVGMTAISRHPHELPKALASVGFVRHRSAVAHHLALIGIYRTWPWGAALDSSPEALVKSQLAVAPEMSLHYWRALGVLAGRYWYSNDRSLSLLNARLHSFIPRLDPSVQRYFLQGVGQFLSITHAFTTRVLAAELERFPHAYQEGLFEGWGMALGEGELISGIPWHGHENPWWMAATKGLSERSLASVQRGKTQFEALFEKPASRALAPPRRAP